MKKLYYKICKQCGETAQLDDLDYQFDGCQDEYYICYKCKEYIHAKSRFGKICKVQRYKMED